MIYIAHWESSPNWYWIIPLLLFWGGWMYRLKISKWQNWSLYSLIWILFAIIFNSPLANLAHHLMMAHMIQHILLLMVIPALLWICLYSSYLDVQKIKLSSTRPIICWVLFIALMWLLHLPSIMSAMHNASSKLLGLHSLISLICLGVGLLFYSVVLAPKRYGTLHPLSGVAYLVSACIGCSLLGITITFASEILYPDFYTIHSAITVAKPLISPKTDQQISGLLMWVPGCLIYISISTFLLYKWHSDSKKNTKIYPSTK